MGRIAKLFPYVLLLVSAVLTGWGTLGLVEYFFAAASFGLQNAKFPDGLQFLHFAAILATGTIFLGGYVMRWRHTPFATVAMYAVLATLCFIETVDFQAFGSGSTRFIPMAMEYVTYLGLSAYLLRSSMMRDHFSPAPESA